MLGATRRAFAMLEAVVADRGAQPVSALAREAGIPVATAHRQVATLVAEELLRPIGGGRHIAGPRLRALGPYLDEKQLITNVATPCLARLAHKTGLIAQLGTLENEMVTYRVKTGEGAGEFFTRVDMQLEAYCSGIGKVLLAALPVEEQADYLSGGPFVALTVNTITDPAALAQELTTIGEQGFAVDNGEIDLDLHCVAVPVHSRDGSVSAAISLSRRKSAGEVSQSSVLARLLSAAKEIERVWHRADEPSLPRDVG